MTHARAHTHARTRAHAHTHMKYLGVSEEVLFPLIHGLPPAFIIKILTKKYLVVSEEVFFPLIHEPSPSTTLLWVKQILSSDKFEDTVI
jgi:hypothetical protein